MPAGYSQRSLVDGLDSKRGMRAHFVALEKDVEVCAVSEVWSGSKLVIPMKDRSGKR